MRKHKAFIMYAIFGVLTTLINLMAYYVLYNVLAWGNMSSTALAWFIAVIFAFITNKKWVFDSQSMALKVLVYELLTFFACRIATGILDMAVMYVAVDVMSWNEMVWKLLSNIIVILLNFVASKLVIFKKK
ncbi:MAG: GtrA family protein [Lachnospiraceae bacterium]|nr:GtrA family protein [Lachnospiraceae bacterium]